MEQEADSPNATRLGRWVTTRYGNESVHAFVPPPLPPKPAVATVHLQRLLEEANQALGRLDGLASMLPNIHLFLYMYLRKEAVLSAQIEGTQSSLSDLLRFENQSAPGVPVDDVEEVSHYVAALEHGLKRLREGFPLSLRLIREIHAILLAGGRGKEKQPGEFRRSQNWIGGTRPGNATFVPPPPELVMECMGQLETFLHRESPDLPHLVQAALVHVQFETIHPFLDGNGRLGRLLITLLLCSRGALQQPMLYLSLYFKKHRQTYYEQLTRVRTQGDWEGWLRFFLEGVQEVAGQAVSTAKRILALLEADRKTIEAGAGRGAPTALRIHLESQTQPIFPIGTMANLIGVTYPTAASAVRQLQRLGIVREVTGRQRDKTYVYEAYLQILSEGTEPLANGRG